MKFIVLMLSLFSASAFANFIEVECEGKSGAKEIVVEIEQPFPRGSMMRRSQLIVTEGGVETVKDYTVTARATRGFSNIRYNGAGLRLEVDFWPDQAPRWGRSYRGSLYSSHLGGEVSNLQCRFPNAF